MSVIIDRAALHEMLRRALPTVKTRTPHEIFRCVKIAAAESRVTLELNNLSVCLRQTTTIAQVERDFTAAVNCERLASVVGSMDRETLKLVPTEHDTVKVQDAASNFALPALDPAAFPAFFGGDEKPACAFTASGKDLARLIRQVRFAAANETTRYAFNGVLMGVAKGKPFACATDGCRMTHLAIAGTDIAGKGECIVPLESAALIERTFGEAESVRCACGERSFRAASEDAEVVSNLIEGAFPPYMDVIPKDTTGTLRAGRESLLALVRRAVVVADELHKGARFTLANGKGISIQLVNPERGRFDETLPCKYEGPDIVIGLNCFYLSEALGVCDTDEVELRVMAPNRAILMLSGEHQYVQMPVNLEQPSAAAGA